MPLSSLVWKSGAAFRAPRIGPSEWENHKEEICQRHKSMSLEELMLDMKTRHGFTPTRHQYLLQYKKWGLAKNKKHSESGGSEASSAGDTSSMSHDLDTPVSFASSETEPSIAMDEPSPLISPSVLSSLPKSRGLVRCHSIRRKRSGGDNDVSYATSKRPRHETAAHGNQASSIDPNVDDIREIYSPHRVGSPFNAAEGRTAHLCPLAHGSPEDARLTIPFQQASDRADLNDIQFSDEVWEDVPDEGDLNWSSAMIIADAAPLRRRRSSDISHEQRQRPTDALPKIGEQELLSYSTTGGPGDLAASVSPECLPSTALRSHMGAGGASSEALETTCSDLFSSPLTELLQYALSGALLDILNEEHFRSVKMAADFLFSSGLNEDAFVVYHWIYESLKNAPSTTPDLLFSAIMDLARSAATASQDRICRIILVRTLHDRTARKERESQETFLLHAFLTMIFRRQEDLARADFHCHRALTCFLLPKVTNTRSKNAWQSLVWTALGLLESSLTEQRLSQFHRELDLESRQRVLSRASDHLVNASRHLWSDDGRTPGASRAVRSGSRLETVIEGDATRTAVLKELLYWCAQALEKVKVIRSLRQSWRKVHKSGTKLRDVSIATLYCMLHEQWREENTAASLASGHPPSWTSRATSDFDLMPHECLAAVPEMLAVTWPYLDEEMPLLSNWRTCLVELQKRALRGIAKLLNESDITVAHLFFEAHSRQCIPSTHRLDAGCGPGKALRVHIFQICSMRFGTLIPSESPEDRFELDVMDFQHTLDPSDRLPSLPPSSSNSLFSRSHLSLTRRTSMHSHPSSRSRGSRRSIRLPLRNRSDASMNSNSSGLASMKSLSKRISHALECREQEQASANEPPSAAVPQMIDEDMELENFIGMASKSLESLSLGPEANRNLGEGNVVL